MKIGFIGMGKLGWPCALAFESRGHDVVGYDVSPAAKEIADSHVYPHREERAQELLDESRICIVDTVAEVVAHADIVLIAVQTPHQPEFEGLTRMPTHRADFDYTALKVAISAVATAAAVLEKKVVVDIISTCLPGTYERELKPLLNEWISVVYTPYFIAMGTTVSDALKPEFVLVGRGDARATDLVQRFYRTISGAPHRVMSITSAELTKVFYNVYLGQKINMANAGMEVAHKVGANIDDVTDALAFATDRVVSAKYMRGGMGDGGGCHPRDQIALSHLARTLNLSRDVFSDMILTREAQTEWLADLADEESRDGKLPVVVLGKAYKKGTNLTLGSPAILLKRILDERPHLRVYQWDPHVDGINGYVGATEPRVYIFGGPQAGFIIEASRIKHDIGGDTLEAQACVYVVATDHDEFYAPEFHVPTGSVVIDPWGKMKDREGIKVIRVGR